MRSQSEIISIIEILRHKLANTVELKEKLTDPEVVKYSRLLDEMLNEYYRLYRQNKK